jgi:hypothetical protein
MRFLNWLYIRNCSHYSCYFLLGPLIRFWPYARRGGRSHLLNGLSRHWEAAYPDPVVANNHDSSSCQIFGDLVHVGQDDG